MDQTHPGTIDQQHSVREAYRLIAGSVQHAVLKRLDASINGKYKRPTLFFGFTPEGQYPDGLLAVAGITGINMRANMAASAVPHLALHELGHVVDRHLLTDAQRDQFMASRGISTGQNHWNAGVQETWADAYRDWHLAGGGPLGALLVA